MSGSDKKQRETEKTQGKLKEIAGKVADDNSMEVEGKVAQAKAEAKQAIDDIKDSLDKSGPVSTGL